MKITTKPRRPEFRRPYYETADRLDSLAREAGEDQALLAMVQEIEAKLDAVREHLNRNYTWD